MPVGLSVLGFPVIANPPRRPLHDSSAQRWRFPLFTLGPGRWLGALRFKGLHRRHGFLAAFGVVLILTVIACWVLLLWSGWILVFLGSDSSIGHNGKAGLWDTAYFVGFSITTWVRVTSRPPAASGRFSPWRISSNR